MEKLIIKRFKSRNQDRIKFVSFLKEFGNIRLKEAKALQDSMIDGIPIELSIKEDHIKDCENILNDLEMDYSIK